MISAMNTFEISHISYSKHNIYLIYKIKYIKRNIHLKKLLSNKTDISNESLNTNRANLSLSIK